MYAKLVLLGTGNPGDGFGVSMPSYTLVSVDYVGRTAVVAFGPRDAPDNPPAQGTPLYPLQGNMYVLIGLPQVDLAAWWAKLARRYPGHVPPFQPNFP